MFNGTGTCNKLPNLVSLLRQLWAYPVQNSKVLRPPIPNCCSIIFTLLNLLSLKNFTVLRHTEQYLQLADLFLIRKVTICFRFFVMFFGVSYAFGLLDSFLLYSLIFVSSGKNSKKKPATEFFATLACLLTSVCIAHVL